MSHAARARFDALTSLRFFAAFHVFLFHYLPLWFPHLVEKEGLLRSLIVCGYTGVPFFFLLSGYVLSYGYEPSISDGSFSRTEFWLRRLFRLWPVMILSLLLGFPPLLAGLLKEGASASGAVSSFGLNLFFLGAWFPQSLRINYPVWSLSVEAFFYLLFPFLMVWPAIKNPRWVGLILLWGASVAILLALCFFDPTLASTPGDRPGEWLRVSSGIGWREFLEVNPIVHLPSFLAGILLRRVHARSTLSLGPIGFLLLISSLGAVFLLSRFLPFLFLHSSLLLPLFAGLILYAVDWPPLQRWLGRPWLVLLGESSFALYLLHVPLRDWISFAWNRLGLRESSYFPALAALAMGGVILVSVIVFHFFERPLLFWLKSRLAKKRTAASSS